MNRDIKSKFNEIGFLSDESTSNQLAQQVTSSGYYRVCKNLNRLAQSLLQKAVVHPDDRKETYMTLYYQRMLSHYQGLIIMAERGMIHQVEIMLRCMMDTLFDLVAFHQNNELFEALILGDSEQRLTLLKRIRKQQEVTATFTQEELIDLDKIIASADDIEREDFKTYIKADMAGMLNDYRTTYSLLSETVHSSMHSLETDLIFHKDSDEIIGLITFGQETGTMSNLLLTSANYIIVAIEILLTLFPNHEHHADLNELHNDVQAEWQTIIVPVQHR